MQISGFTIIKNAILNSYPIVEAITSILPVVTEMIVLVGDSEDDTLNLIQSINDPKIKIHHSVWDKTRRSGGTALAVETNKAFELIDTNSDWAFYIQADEVVHEKDHPAILKGCETYKDDPRVEGLLFKYIHFYGTYDYVGDSRKWYAHEVRIIKNDKKIQSYKDAQGFRVGNRKLWVKSLNASIYHYGWVKSPEKMSLKFMVTDELWGGDKFIPKDNVQLPKHDFSNFDSLKRFDQTHPSVMKTLINEKNWNLNLDISQKNISLKNRLLLFIEKATGIRLFDFRNYKLLR